MKRESKNAAALREAASAAGIQVSAAATEEIARITESSVASTASTPAPVPVSPTSPPAASEAAPAPEAPADEAPAPEVPGTESDEVSAERPIVDTRPIAIDQSRLPEEDQFSVSVYRKDIAAMEEIKAILRANGYLTIGNSQAIRVALRALTKSPKLIVGTYAKMLPEDKRRKAEPKKKRS